MYWLNFIIIYKSKSLEHTRALDPSKVDYMPLLHFNFIYIGLDENGRCNVVMENHFINRKKSFSYQQFAPKYIKRYWHSFFFHPNDKPGKPENNTILIPCSIFNFASE